MQGKERFSPESVAQCFPDPSAATPRTLIGQFLETPAHLREDRESQSSLEQDENWPPARVPLRTAPVCRDALKQEARESNSKVDLKALADKQKTIDALEAQKRELAKRLREETCRCSEFQKQLRDLNSENRKLTEDESALRETLREAETLMHKHEETREVLVHENANLAAELASIKASLQRKEAELAKYKEKTTEVKERLRSTQDTLMTREKNSEEIEESHQKQVYEYERQQLLEIEDIHQRVADGKRKLELATTEIKRMESELATERARNHAGQREQAALKRRMETMGVAVPRYDILPWVVAFFLGALVSLLPLWRFSWPVVG